MLHKVKKQKQQYTHTSCIKSKHTTTKHVDNTHPGKGTNLVQNQLIEHVKKDSKEGKAQLL